MTRELLNALGAAAPAGEEAAPSAPPEETIPTPPLSPPSGKGARGDAEDADCHTDDAAPERNDKGNAEAPAAPDPELAAIRRHFDRLLAGCEALSRQLPGFDPAAALRDADFLRLTAPGMGVDPRRAWLALHPELLERRAAQTSAAALARSLASGAGRPREGGGQTGAALSADYRSLPRAEQQRLKERILQAAAQGEKIYP